MCLVGPSSDSFEILFDALFGDAESARQRNFCEVEVVKTGDVLLMRAGHRFLRLDDFDRVRDARAETVARLRQCLFGQVNVAARNVDLLG